MKTRLFIPFLMIVVLLVSGIVTATTASADDENGPRITSFTTSINVVSRSALINRVARVPVSWKTENRPVYANLFFEQLLPGDDVLNVELPRSIPWVASSGDGVAAPILPGPDASEIELRVRLVNLLNGQTMDERRLTLPIDNSSGSDGNNSNRPAINSFTSCCAIVSPAQLANRTARVPVSWSTSNRPNSANLIFEQVLPNGSAVNVELPRENPWVASSGDGVAAPVSPGEGATSLLLRVRLVDLVTGRVYDQRSLTVAISETNAHEPRIRYFTTSVNSVNATELAQRTARVPVSWATDNRPDGTNLVFEQVLSDTQSVNVELPRSNPWVASSGDGVAAPVLPETGDTIRLRVRLVNLANNQTITSKDLTLPIQGRYALTNDNLERSGNTTIDNSVVADDSPLPEVVAFNVSDTELQPGETITVSWDVRNATSVAIRLALREAEATDALADSQPATGSTTLTVPEELAIGMSGHIVLHAYTMPNAPAAVTQSIPVSLTCSHTFFFGESADHCVTGRAVEVNASVQMFERGMLFWHADRDEIVVLPGAGTILVQPDEWNGSDAVEFEQTPPDGFELPQRGFGHLWTSSSLVRDLLGWATGPEQGYTATIQRGVSTAATHRGSNQTFISLPDSRVLQLYHGAATTWNLIG